MTHDFAEAVLKGLKDEREGKVAGLVAGALSHDDYKYRCGEIHGLDLAMDHITTVLKKTEDPDDE